MSQLPYSDAHLSWPHSSQPLSGEIARLALMNEEFSLMVASLGTPKFFEAKARFHAAKSILEDRSNV